MNQTSVELDLKDGSFTEMVVQGTGTLDHIIYPFFWHQSLLKAENKPEQLY